MEVDIGSSAGGRCFSFSDRQIFEIELKPGETTIVSWKKLIREANKKKSCPPALEPPLAAPQPTPETGVAPSHLTESEPKDVPLPNRFNAVVEKIERLYLGNQSGDNEELRDVPNDDQYDTKDSFIDDTGLDEYFQVDLSPTKHNEFFVNKGKLERINEPSSSADCQPKKRKKNMMKAPSKSDGNLPNKHPKLGHVRLKAAARTTPLSGKSSIHSQSLAADSDRHCDGKFQHPLNASIESDSKKSSESSTKALYSSYSTFSNNDASEFSVIAKDTEKQRIGIAESSVFPVKVKDTEKQRTRIESCNLACNVKDSSQFYDDIPLKYQRRNVSKQLSPQVKNLKSNTGELEFSNSTWCRAKNQLPDLNIAVSDDPAIATQTSSVNPKDVSWPKETTLERAIIELERVVTESRPLKLEVPGADTSSIATKRRLPFNVKLKLAKVARLAQSSQGKISEELVNHLMRILGHLVQLRTLKRNLREMVLLELSEKREKDDMFQQIKKEVIEMIKFQEVFGSEEKGVLEGKYYINNAVEDKICDLYDLYVQGLDEDKGQQSRKLYEQLAELWPSGAMDSHGVKSAISKAKERRRALYDREKVQENVRRKKLTTPRTEGITRGEASSTAQPQSVQDRQISDPNVHNLVSSNRMISSTNFFNGNIAAPTRTSGPFLKGSNMYLPKHDKVQRMTFPTLKEEMKQLQRDSERRVKKSSLKLGNESHKSHLRGADGQMKQATGWPMTITPSS